MTDPERVQRVLAVDDEEVWRGFIGTRLTEAGVEHEIVEDTDTAVERIGTGEVTGVITDGLDGGWKRVVEAAKEAGVPAALMSLSSMVVAAAQKEGVLAFNKNIIVDPEAMRMMIQVVAPEPAA